MVRAELGDAELRPAVIVQEADTGGGGERRGRPGVEHRLHAVEVDACSTAESVQAGVRGD